MASEFECLVFELQLYFLSNQDLKSLKNLGMQSLSAEAEQGGRRGGRPERKVEEGSKKTEGGMHL